MAFTATHSHGTGRFIVSAVRTPMGDAYFGTLAVGDEIPWAMTIT